MRIDTLLLIYKDNFSWVLFYAIYSSIICFCSVLAQYFWQHSRLDFFSLTAMNTFICLTAVVTFILIIIGLWFGLRIANSEVLFILLATVIQFIVLVALHLYLQKRAGLLLNTPVFNALIVSFLLVAPLIGLSVFISGFSNVGLR